MVNNMLVVLDTNVLISGAFFGGLPAELIALVEQAVITPCFTVETFNELQTTLFSEKFAKIRTSLDFSFDDFLLKIRDHSRLFSLDIKPEAVITEDPADNYILACALAAGAGHIISGDNHLLKLKEFQSVKILTPRQFLDKIKNKHKADI